MIKMEELNKKGIDVDSIVESNLITLMNRLNKLQAQWQKPMIVTSALRTPEQQENLIKAGKTNAKKSKHLFGAAADIYDPENKLREWLLENPQVLEECNLWCEHWSATPTWVHFQIFPPASGNRWFYP